MTMRLPAVTPARRAQRRADVLARCITIAKTPEDAQRFRAGYQLAAARAASLARTDVPTGLLERVLAPVRRHPILLVLVVLGVLAQELFINFGPAQAVNDGRWFVTGAAAYAVGCWVWARFFARPVVTVWVYEEDGHDC